MIRSARLPRPHATSHQTGGADPLTPQSIGGRELLTAARKYYVRSDGDDGNTGLVDSSGGAFLTIQKAVNVAAALDVSIYNVTIQVRDGTFNEAVTLKSAVGSGSITIQGNSGTPANVVVNNSSGSGSVGTFTATNVLSTYIIKDLKITCTGGAGIIAGNSYIEYSNLDFGACQYGIQTVEFGYVRATGNYTISGAADRHWTCAAGVIRAQSITITITGTPAFATAFALAARGGMVFCGGNTFSGSATGPRYYVATTGVLDTSAGGSTYLPGNSAGTADATTYGAYV